MPDAGTTSACREHVARLVWPAAPSAPTMLDGGRLARELLADDAAKMHVGRLAQERRPEDREDHADARRAASTTMIQPSLRAAARRRRRRNDGRAGPCWRGSSRRRRSPAGCRRPEPASDPPGPPRPPAAAGGPHRRGAVAPGAAGRPAHATSSSVDLGQDDLAVGLAGPHAARRGCRCRRPRRRRGPRSGRRAGSCPTRWATMITVASPSSRPSAARRRASVRKSSAEKLSSKT